MCFRIPCSLRFCYTNSFLVLSVNVSHQLLCKCISWFYFHFNGFTYGYFIPPSVQWLLLSIHPDFRLPPSMLLSTTLPDPLFHWSNLAGFLLLVEHSRRCSSLIPTLYLTPTLVYVCVQLVLVHSVPYTFPSYAHPHLSTTTKLNVSSPSSSRLYYDILLLVMSNSILDAWLIRLNVLCFVQSCVRLILNNVQSVGNSSVLQIQLKFSFKQWTSLYSIYIIEFARHRHLRGVGKAQIKYR